MLRATILFSILLVGCSSQESGQTAPLANAPSEIESPVVQAPLVDAEVIGLPGARVPGMDAIHVDTLDGWLAPDDAVIFEGVIQWTRDGSIACGIFRRAPDGDIRPLLLQGQPLPNTNGGRVQHPRLPTEARGDRIFLATDVVGGNTDHVLLSIAATGGAPTIVARTDAGVFGTASATEDGTVLVEHISPGGSSLIRTEPGQASELLCNDGAHGFSMQEGHVVVRRPDAVWLFDADGTEERVLGIDDPVPGSMGVATAVLGAWINEHEDVILHVRTDDARTPDVLLRRTLGEWDVVARCGAPLPGDTAFVESIEVAAGHTTDVVFAATLEGGGTAIYCARPSDLPELLVRSEPQRALLARDVITDGPQIAYGAAPIEEGISTARAVYRAGSSDALLVTGDRVPNARDAIVRSFPLTLREGLDVDSKGRVLVHAGLVEDRRPDAVLGALLIVR